MTTTTTLRDAVSRSISHDETVTVTVEGMDSGDVLVALDTLIDSDTDEIDYTMIDHQGVDRMDVWASRPEGEMIWRLDVRFSDGKVTD